MKTISRKQLASMQGATVKSRPKADPTADAATSSAAAAAEAKAAAEAALGIATAAASKLDTLTALISEMRASKHEAREDRGPVTATIIRDDRGMLEQVVFDRDGPSGQIH